MPGGVSAPKAVSILISGSEILDGRVLDSNSNFIASRLTECGVPLREVVVLGDEREPLAEAIRRLSSTSSHLVLSGGLGPTDDDLTREVVASTFGVPLSEFPEARAHITSYFEQRRRVPDPSNFKQALLPEGSSMIPNPIGTAPGFSAVFGETGTTLYALPGVPRELKGMFEETVLPSIRGAFTNAVPLLRRSIRVFGLPEAEVGSLVKSCALGADFDVSYRASFPEIHVVLKRRGDVADLDRAAREVEAAIGAEFIVNRDLAVPFERVVLSLLSEHEQSISLFEGMTGGVIGGLLSEHEGASRVLKGAIAPYGTNREVAGLVMPKEVAREGLVSGGATLDLAKQVRELFASGIGVAVNGIAGPGGGSEEKPVGTFFVGFSTPQADSVFRFHFPSSRTMIRRFAAFVTFDLVRRHLLNLPAPARHVVSPAPK